jgi:hypothetical protein
LVQFSGKTFTAFADEKLEAEFDDFILTGRADWFVAKGKYKPEKPYLFLQEYSGTPPELLNEEILTQMGNYWQKCWL